MASDLSLGDLPLFAPAPRRVEAPPYVSGSETSRQAAQAIAPVAGTLRDRVLKIIEDSEHGLTDEEGIALAGVGPNTYRPRRIELVSMGLVKQMGHRLTRSGRHAAVWALAR